MKNLLLVLFSSLIGCVSFAAPLAGILEKNDQGTFVTLTVTSQKYQISAITGDAVDAIAKLDSGDYITGNGVINDTNHTIQVDNLDYVGLKKMLGMWYSGASVMNFSSFTDLSVYSVLAKDVIVALAPKTDLLYSMAPYSGNQWAMFLSTKDVTIFATIEFTDSDATMRIFDSDTGDNNRTVHLVRWPGK